MTPEAAGSLRRASVGEIAAVAAGIGLELSETDCRSCRSLMEDCLEACRTVEQLNVQPLAPRYPKVLEVLLVAGRWLTGTYRGRFYGKAQNAAQTLRAAYDAALVDHDLLLMPTVLSSAAPHPRPDASRELQLERAVAGTPNAAPFNVTGHPAISVPCGWLNDMPAGLMLVGRHFAAHDIYRAASALEAVVGTSR